MTFPAQTILASYRATEAKLSAVLAVVPYCSAHEAVWSPDLVTVLLEAGSQLDSLWRAESRLSSCTVSKPDIVDFFTYFGNQLAPRWLVLWGESPFQLHPFQEWQSRPSHTKQDYLPLAWWQAFTSVKHDRLENRERASLKNSVLAVASLFLPILRCPECRDEIAQARWLSCLGQERDEPSAWLGEDCSSVQSMFITAETHLFTYPVWWGSQRIVTGDIWKNQGASHRFRRWFDAH